MKRKRKRKEKLKQIKVKYIYIDSLTKYKLKMHNWKNGMQYGKVNNMYILYIIHYIYMCVCIYIYIYIYIYI